MNYGVTANIEGDTLTLTNQEGQTQTFEVKGKNERKIDIRQSGRTTFTYEFPNGVTVSIRTGGSVHSITVTKDQKPVYTGSLVSKEVTDALIEALLKKATEGGKRKKTIRRSKKKRSKKTSKGRRNI
jgi:hypothetical protein